MDLLYRAWIAIGRLEKPEGRLVETGATGVEGAGGAIDARWFSSIGPPAPHDDGGRTAVGRKDCWARSMVGDGDIGCGCEMERCGDVVAGLIASDSTGDSCIIMDSSTGLRSSRSSSLVLPLPPLTCLDGEALLSTSVSDDTVSAAFECCLKRGVA